MGQIWPTVPFHLARRTMQNCCYYTAQSKYQKIFNIPMVLLCVNQVSMIIKGRYLCFLFVSFFCFCIFKCILMLIPQLRPTSKFWPTMSFEFDNWCLRAVRNNKSSSAFSFSFGYTSAFASSRPPLCLLVHLLNGKLKQVLLSDKEWAGCVCRAASLNSLISAACRLDWHKEA